MSITIQFDDKPHLYNLVKQDKKKAEEVMQTFISLMEEAVKNGWHLLPQKFATPLTFSDLVKGVLHGALDVEAINPDAHAVLKEEVHPFSMLMPRKNLIDGGMIYWDWRYWYRLPPNTPITQETVSQIIRKLLRYYKLVSVESLANALNNNQLANWSALQNPNMIANLPFLPALRYQKAMFDDLHVGRFFDSVGAFDCGTWIEDTNCHACQSVEIHKVGKYHICLSCNAGYKEEVV